jgi:integrase
MRGNITKRGKRSWRIKFDLDCAQSGERTTRYITIQGTRKDAEAELNRLLNDATLGVLVDPNKVTVAQHLRAWLDGKRDSLSPATQESYARLIGALIIPTLGAIELQKLKPFDVQNWLVALRQGKRGQRSARSIVNVHRVLRAALQAAVKLDMVGRNVADAVDLPKSEVREVAILRAHEVPAVLDALKGSRLYPPGMRRSELLALRWCDVDLKSGALKVEHSLEQTKAGLRLKSPKTKRGRRSIVLPAFAVDMLNEHRKARLELRLQLGMGKPESEALVFCNHDGSPISPNALSQACSRGGGLAQADLP